ncbi:MAG: hypothetical protein R2697_05320 [Ilumatobacteraceae bacterium]
MVRTTTAATRRDGRRPLRELKATADPARQQEILLEVEQNLVAGAFGVPLFQFLVSLRSAATVSNIDPIAISPTIFWSALGLRGSGLIH